MVIPILFTPEQPPGLSAPSNEYMLDQVVRESYKCLAVSTNFH